MTPVRFHGDKELFEIGDVVETPEGTFTIGDPANPPKTEPAPTHWQRFKSWLAKYGYELLGGAFVLAILAGLGALLYWNTGSERCRIAQRASNARQSAFSLNIHGRL